MQKVFKLLVINPGSTSTKVAFFNNEQCISSRTLRHKAEELEMYNTISEQYPLRKQAIMEYMADEGIDALKLDAVIGRGGLLKPLKGGVYNICSTMLDDLKSNKYGKHASNLGAILAHEIASLAAIPAFIVNPVVVDEFEPLARFSGMPEIARRSAFHALNQKAIAAKASAELGKQYNEVNLIVAHLGGGISVAAHKKGKVVDVNNALEEGPFSPERTGSIPVMQLVDMCFSGQYTKAEIEKKLVGKGGLVAYLGTSDCMEIEERIKNGDSGTRMVFEAMAYQVAKEIGSCSTVLHGCVDSIILTGGIARSKDMVDWITERVSFIAPVRVYPGEDEMWAMADGAMSVLSGYEDVLDYDMI